MQQAAKIDFSALIAFDRAHGVRVAGIDEAGRGPLAGPVCAACVVPDLSRPVAGVYDSKKLTAARREQLYGQILETALFYRAVLAGSAVIDRLNIRNATLFAMREAAKGAPAQVFFIDGKDQPLQAVSAHALVKGDAKSYAVACASIVAKVTRDRYMQEADRLFPAYSFARHKGYGTAAHISALQKKGPCPLHRSLFIRNFTNERVPESTLPSLLEADVALEGGALA